MLVFVLLKKSAQFNVDMCTMELEKAKSDEDVKRCELNLEVALDELLNCSKESEEDEESLFEEEEFNESIYSQNRKKFKLDMNSIPPDSFSSASLDSIKIESFPLLKKATRIDFELKAGQCLFLPAGWFHNVTSLGDENGVHMALNMWTVPHVSDISDNYWRYVWNDILEELP